MGRSLTPPAFNDFLGYLQVCAEGTGFEPVDRINGQEFSRLPH